MTGFSEFIDVAGLLEVSSSFNAKIVATGAELGYVHPVASCREV